MESTKRNARVAGFVYLLLGVAAPLRLVYIPATLFVRGNAEATAANIAAHEALFRAGMIGDLFAGTIAIFVTLALYRLFKQIDRNMAALVVILGSLMVTPIYFMNVLNDSAALMFARGPDFLSVFDKPQRDALVLLFIRLHHDGVVVNEIFWGLWLFPFGALIIKSRFLPRVLGYWLLVGGVAYVVLSFTGLLAPEYEQTVSNFAFPAMFGEVAVMLWLVIRGATEPSPALATV